MSRRQRKRRQSRIVETMGIGTSVQKPRTGSKEWLQLVKRNNPQAYSSWGHSEDILLKQRIRDGWTVQELANAHGRRTGAITSRIRKLNLDRSTPIRFSSRRNTSLIDARKRRVKKMSNHATEEMKRRMESGEFGNPPDMQMVNDAWADLLESEMQRMGTGANYHSICGLWPRNGDKVAFDGRTQEDVTIPAGTKVLCFYGNPEPGTRQPEFRLVYVSYDD
jgi:hypothetical protein